MAGVSVITVVQSLRERLTSDPAPSPQKILRILQKLSVLPISVDVLHETGIGKVVNGFRKHEGDIAESARNLVRSWKAKVREAMNEEASRQDSGETLAQGRVQPEASSPAKPHSPLRQHGFKPDTSASPSTSRLHSPKHGSSTTLSTSPTTKPKTTLSLTTHSSPLGSTKSQDLSKSHNPSKSHDSSKSHGPMKSHDSSRPRYSTKSHASSKSHDPLKSRDSSKSHDSNHPHDSLKSCDSSKSHDSAKRPIELKRHGGNSLPEGGFTQLKEKHSLSSGSPVKKLKSHHYPGSGTAKVHDKKDATTENLQSHSEMKSDTVTHKSHVRSHDRSHHKASTSGVKKSSEHKQTRPSGLHHASPEKHHSVSSKHSVVNEKHSKARHQTSLSPELQKSPKSVGHQNSATNGDVVSKTSAPHKSVEPSHSSSADSDKTKPKKAEPKRSSSEGKTKRDSSLDDSWDDDQSEGRDFRNTGMSFGDCLLGPMATKVKKVAKSRTPVNSTLPLTTLTTTSKSSTQRSVARDDRANPSKTKDPAGGSKHEKKFPGTQSVEGHASGGQSSSKGHRSEEGRRNRKKRSMSEEEEEAIKMAKKRRESVEVSLSLPEIQPTYKPIRPPEAPSPVKKRTMTPEEEMSFLASKQGRTKVFSGRSRLNRLTSVPRLYDICMEILCDNIDAIDDVGGVPYDVLLPVLKKCTPQQLFHLEDCNPHFLEDTDPLWQKHTERDFRSKMPDEMESWREVYIREHDAREARLKSITANISAHMAAKDPGRLTKMAFLDRPAKPPRSVMRQQQRHGTASGNFSPEKRTHSTVQPNRSPSVIGHSSGAESSGLSRRQAKPAKVVAPMMMKTLRMIKKLRR